VNAREKLDANEKIQWLKDVIAKRDAEIERLREDRQALLGAAKKTAELVERQAKQSIEQQAKIDRLTAELEEAHRNETAACEVADE